MFKCHHLYRKFQEICTFLQNVPSAPAFTLTCSCCCCCCRSCCHLLVQSVKILSLRAVHVEPPVADEVLLVEQGPVGAEEAVLDEVGVTKVGTDVECLALSFGVSIVTLQIHPMKINSHQAIYGFPPLCSRRSQNWSPGERHRWDNLHLEIQGLPQTRPQWGQPASKNHIGAICQKPKSDWVNIL